MADQQSNNLMEKIVALCKRRGIIFPGSEIYGGLAGTWDYGPAGALMKKNLKDLWWKEMVQLREDVVGIDAAIFMNPRAWEASGHTEGFTDPLVECKVCHQRFREDKPDEIEAHEKTHKGQKVEWTEPKTFNILVKAFLGIIEGKQSEVYYFLMDDPLPKTKDANFISEDLHFKSKPKNQQYDLGHGSIARWILGWKKYIRSIVDESKRKIAP